MTKERSFRSDRYQYKILEVNSSDEFLSSFSNSQSLNPELYNEQFLTLQDRLKERVNQLTEIHLTQRQKDIWKMYCDGYTQQEMSKTLNVNQSSVCKTLNGNTDYRSGTTKSYGGIYKKMRRICFDDAEILKILSLMEELEDNLKM